MKLTDDIWVQPCSMVSDITDCGKFIGAASSTNSPPPNHPPVPVVPTIPTTSTTPVSTITYFPNYDSETITVGGVPGVVYNNAVMSIPDSPLFTASFWVRIPDGSINSGASTWLGFAFPGVSNGPVLIVQLSWNFNYDFALQVTDTNNTVRLVASTFDGAFSANATGHHIFVSADTNHAAGLKLINLYCDGVSVIDTDYTDDTGAAFNIGFKGCEFGVPNVNEVNFLDNVNTYLTEMWIACGQYVDPSQISKFRDPVTGLPVPLGADGSLPTGIKPTYYLTGGPAQFAVNAGSGPTVSSAGFFTTGTFNNFIDANQLTVFFANGRSGPVHGGYVGIFQDPCSASDSPFLTISMWVRCFNANPDNPNFFNGPNLASVGYNSGTGEPNIVFLTGAFASGTADINVGFSGAIGATQGVGFASSSSPFTTSATGHHIFISMDTNHAAGAKLLNLYCDGVNVLDPALTSDASAAFNIKFSGRDFGLPDVDSIIGLGETDIDYAEVWIACGQYVAPSNITKFRSPAGKPVNLGANGQLPTGTSPTYYFKGPWSNFDTNLGTGGSVTRVVAAQTSPGFTVEGSIGDSTWALTE